MMDANVASTSYFAQGNGVGKIYYDSVNNEVTTLETAKPNAVLNPFSPDGKNEVEMNEEGFATDGSQDHAPPASTNVLYGSISANDSSDEEKGNED